MQEVTPINVEDFGAGESSGGGTQVVEPISTVDPFANDPGYGVDHNTWAAKKVLEGLVPFGKFMFTPSGREEVTQSRKDLLAYLAVSSLEVFAPKLVTIGGKLVGNGIRNLGKALNKPIPFEPFDKVRQALPAVDLSLPTDMLKRRGIFDFEAKAVLGDVSIKDFIKDKDAIKSQAFMDIIDWKKWKKGEEVAFKPEFQKALDFAKLGPEEKIFEHYKDQWRKATMKVYGPNFVGDTLAERTLQVTAKKVFGEEIAKGLTMKNIEPDMFANLAVAMTQPNIIGRLRRAKSLGAGSFIPSALRPIAHVMGASDELYGTFPLYKLGKEAYGKANVFAVEEIAKLHQILADKGLGKIEHLLQGETKFKLTAPKQDYLDAGKALGERLQMIQDQAPIDILNKHFLKQNENVREFLRGWEKWSDNLLELHLESKTLRTLHNAKITEQGLREFDKLFYGPKGVKETIHRAFDSDANVYDKAYLWEYEMQQIRDWTDYAISQKWFGTKNPELLVKAFAEGKNGKGFVNYTDNFSQFINVHRKITESSFAASLSGKDVGRFFPLKDAIPLEQEFGTDFGAFVEARARIQSRDMFLYPAFNEIVKSVTSHPGPVREYIGHWLFRMLGRPSPMDAKVASWLENSVGRVEAILGAKSGGLWNAQRVLNLSRNINNMLYMGGIGFKPFGAMRNLLQYPTLVPTDLGGVGSAVWLAKGLSKAMDKNARKYLQDIGVITEYAPELHVAARAINVGKELSLLGKHWTAPDAQQVRDWAMWMFQGTDRMLRYATGGAAMSKWEHYAAKLADAEGRLGESFIKKMRFDGRNKWVAKELRDYLATGTPEDIAKAKKLFVTDVVGDTQYLYGVTDSPIISQTGGSLGKMATVFQSWWMNYLALLEKWARTGTLDTKGKRALNFFFSAAVADQLMEPMWGRTIAMATVGAGPIPSEASEFTLVPPAFAPFYRALAITINGAKGDPDAVQRHLQGLFRSGWMFAPGGLQLYSSWTGAQKEGFPGFLKSIMRIKQDEDYEPLWGLLR